MIIGDSLLDSLGNIGMWGAIAILAICGAACDIAKKVMRHKERMAKIQMGIDPDAPRRTSDGD
jgi:hypothetical protein